MKRGFIPINDISCPIHSTIAVIQGKWTLLILRDLTTGAKRFGDFGHSKPYRNLLAQ